MVVRHVIAAAIALSITIGLFYVMQLLISMGSGEGTDIDKGRVIEFVRLKRESETQIRKRQLPKKEKPPEPPPPPELQMSTPDSADSGEMAIAAPSMDMTPDISGGLNMGGAPSDSDTVPLVRVPPQYPVRAAERGIEGYVVMRFTISAAGTVKNPIVVDAKPARIFDRAAIRAIKKWKYRPKIEDGVAVERANIEVKLAFTLDDG
jgi:protein TonB